MPDVLYRWKCIARVSVSWSGRGSSSPTTGSTWITSRASGVLSMRSSNAKTLQYRPRHVMFTSRLLASSASCLLSSWCIIYYRFITPCKFSKVPYTHVIVVCRALVRSMRLRSIDAFA